MSPLEFVPAAEVPPTQNIVLYGPSGTGKTIGAASAPGPVIVVNAEGSGGIRKARLMFGEKVQEVRMTGAAVLREVYLYLRDGDGKGRFKTVVIDTVGEVYKALLDEMSGDAPRPTLQQYGDVNVQISRLVRALRDLDLNVVLVCHEESMRDETTGEVTRRPSTGGKKLPDELCAQADIVGYCAARTREDGEVEYVAQLVPGSGRTAKDRSGNLGVVRRIDLTEWIATATAKPAAPKAAERKAAA